MVAILAACGSPPPANGNAASLTRTDSTPVQSPATDDRKLALVTLRGSETIVVRDLTDINHPKTVDTLGQVTSPQFVSATELSYEDTATLYSAPLSGLPKTVIAQEVGLFAWSADGTKVAYMTADGLHVITAGQNRGLGEPLPVPAGGYGCESQSCADFWDGRLAFSPDGGYISLVVQSGPVIGFKLWSSDGKLLASPSSQGGTMSVWSGRTLYFRDAGGVEAWTDGVTSPFLPGVQWVRPKGSPAGGAVLYEARDSSGLAHVYLVDTATKKVRELKSGRSEPAFLTSRYVWYSGERFCVASDSCAAGPTIPTGKTYVYDLQTGVEYDSIITNVYDIWPHAA